MLLESLIHGLQAGNLPGGSHAPCLAQGPCSLEGAGTKPSAPSCSRSLTKALLSTQQPWVRVRVTVGDPLHALGSGRGGVCTGFC